MVYQTDGEGRKLRVRYVLDNPPNFIIMSSYGERSEKRIQERLCLHVQYLKLHQETSKVE